MFWVIEIPLLVGVCVVFVLLFYYECINNGGE